MKPPQPPNPLQKKPINSLTRIDRNVQYLHLPLWLNTYKSDIRPRTYGLSNVTIDPCKVLNLNKEYS